MRAQVSATMRDRPDRRPRVCMRHVSPPTYIAQLARCPARSAFTRVVEQRFRRRVTPPRFGRPARKPRRRLRMHQPVGDQGAGCRIENARPDRRRANEVGGKKSGGERRVDMCIACLYAFHMSAMIQIRNVPDALHRRLKSRAALAGMSLSDYLLSEIREVAARPTLEELRSRLERRSSTMLTITPVEAVRAERDRQ